MAVLPSLSSKYTNFIKQRTLEGDDKPLRLRIEHGRRCFQVILKLAANEIGSKISLRHLAEMVYCQTGIMPKEQKYYFKNLSWENPEMGPWSPSLRSLGVKNGDKIQLVSFHHAFPDWEQNEQLDRAEQDIKKVRTQLSKVFYKVQASDLHRSINTTETFVFSTTVPTATSESTMNTFEEWPNQELLKSEFTLAGIFGSKEFSIHFSNQATATVADLAQVVYGKTGIVPHRQRLVFKGIIFDPPDTDMWAPLLEDLNFRNGDKVEVSQSARPLSKEDSEKELEQLNEVIHKLGSDVDEMVSKRDRVQQGYMEGGNQVMALTFLRREFESVKEKLMENVQVLNSLNFDHRNAVGQAKRRELVDFCQRQIDKCSEMSTYIFHKLAQAHYLSNVGKIYTQDFRLPQPRNKWAKKKP